MKRDATFVLVICITVFIMYMDDKSSLIDGVILMSIMFVLYNQSLIQETLGEIISNIKRPKPNSDELE